MLRILAAIVLVNVPLAELGWGTLLLNGQPGGKAVVRTNSDAWTAK